MIYVFGDCELDEALYELRHGGVPVKLEPKAFRVLAYLIRHRDRVVTKDELIEKLWPGEFVTESALTRCIVKARQAVQDDGVAQRVIKTVHGHGFRFVAAVDTHVHSATTNISPADRTTARKAAEPAPSIPKYQADNTLTGRQTRQGERKQVTILAAGVKGIAALAQAIDPEILDEVLSRIFGLLRTEVQSVEGVISQVTSEGLMALFGAPIAHEDHAVRALHAALGMQRAFAAFANDQQHMHRITLALRLGLHSGTAMVSIPGDTERMAHTAQGFATYLGSSLQERAIDRAIYVSEAVRQQAAGFFRFNDLGELILPEVPQPVRVYECTGVDQVSSRLEAFYAAIPRYFSGVSARWICSAPSGPERAMVRGRWSASSVRPESASRVWPTNFNVR
jgi:DNA-binding winged helix-turn-helix (wHTH) protein